MKSEHDRFMRQAMAQAELGDAPFGAVLVQDGRLQRKNMLWEHISKHDLEEDMRLEAKTDDLSKIQVARLERSGDISFIETK